MNAYDTRSTVGPESSSGRLEATLHRELGLFRAEVSDRIDRWVRINLVTNIATMVTLSGLVLAFTKLG